MNTCDTCGAVYRDELLDPQGNLTAAMKIQISDRSVRIARGHVTCPKCGEFLPEERSDDTNIKTKG